MMRFLKSLLPAFVKRRIADTAWFGPLIYRAESYASEGEDAILEQFLRADLQKSINAVQGFYVDVGAHHPISISMTYRYYRAGWRGINIDADPNSMRLFQRIRPRDINLTVAIGSSDETRCFYLFRDSPYNTFIEERVAYLGQQGIVPIDKVSVPQRPLCDILAEHLWPGQEITFMNVDVEGAELEVLRSNDWKKFRPQYLLVEELHNYGDNAPKSNFVLRQNYTLIGRTFNTGIYRDNQRNSANACGTL